MENLGLILGVKLLVGFLVGAIISVCLKFYYRAKNIQMPENTIAKVFGATLFYALFLLEALFALVVLLVLYVLDLIVCSLKIPFRVINRTDFERFYYLHLPIATIIVVAIMFLAPALNSMK